MMVIVASFDSQDKDVLQTLYNKIAKCTKTIELSATERGILTILTRNMLNSIKCETSTRNNNTK